MLRKSVLILSGIICNLLLLSLSAQEHDLSDASLIISETIAPDFRETIADILQEELFRLAQIRMPLSERWTENNIALSLAADRSLYGEPLPPGVDLPAADESYSMAWERRRGRETLWLIGKDERALLYAAGHLLREVRFGFQRLTLKSGSTICSAPVYPIRGHQLGYRNTANSYDGWSPEQYDRYIRELALFGANSIENIPLETPDSPHMLKTPQEMNYLISRMCEKYRLDYWVWMPVGDLSNDTVFNKEKKKHADFYKACPKLDNIFIPGGDPGDNHPRELLRFLETISGELRRYHPDAGIWMSLQGFSDEECDYLFSYLDEVSPNWLKGIVSGPGSPSLAATRYRLPEKYMHRHYPDITHTVRCQYPTLDWDQAFALTLGREPVNPQPFYYAMIHNRFAPYTDGFISYSDGINDDLNKFVWSRKGWDPDEEVTEILAQYVRFFFGISDPEPVVNAIAALEKNWEGPVDANAGIEMTLREWDRLEQEYPRLNSDWRWQMCLYRANYDAYIRRRNLYEKRLEREAYRILLQAGSIGISQAMKQALEKVNEADSFNVAPELKRKIHAYADSLFLSISLQSSMERHRASGPERGCTLDFLDHPLNNRWWLADEFRKVEQMQDDEEKLERITILARWDNPGEGSFYDNISNIAESPHVLTTVYDATDFAWWDRGLSRKRLSTQLFQNFPKLEYNDLDPNARYLIRIAGYGDALLRVDGERIAPILYNKELETFKEFLVDPRYTRDGSITVTFDEPEESHLNWRQHSKICDIWLLRRD
ncbi:MULTISPECIES: hypothetical protein [Petrimonas]|jgi:hypothetical protein|uniref:Alpha glucuronidase N-terminal domain-containing protein n=1 Tax=Petrimonas mucosa TaxID=1642646 RepID=A0A1G4G4A1_9BACT|nr:MULTISPECIES: hypothetical protein [Petrimonas]MDD3561186.1 hypothetical protein [Petrimonas mucosa]SCM55716.1 putative protein {ECO:0000313/EMBL:EON79017,1} [Petrimonas mucosa]SFU61717.1 hypothetical protein SAMN05216364_103812 [Porphyromonadaceae bacterium KHP3R9]HHT28955.1 hypothetical protein [Petrimonas mucosa]